MCFVSKFSPVDAINRFSIEYIGVNCMLGALVFSFGSSDGGLVIDEREKRSICIKQALYSRTQSRRVWRRQIWIMEIFWFDVLQVTNFIGIRIV